MEISGDVTDPDGRTNERTTRKDRATQLLICEVLSFAMKMDRNEPLPSVFDDGDDDNDGHWS